MVTDKISNFFNNYGRWIGGILFILFLGWADARYITHDEENKTIETLRLGEVEHLIHQEEDLRQRQTKKIKELNEFKDMIRSAELDIAVLKNEIKNLKDEIDEIKK